MSINDLMVMRGRLATDVTLHPPKNPASQRFARFRMVVPRVRRTDSGQWEEGEPLWYTIRAWGALAENISLSLRKGQPIIVAGRPSAHAWLTGEGELRSEISVNAMSIGHDLVFGVASYSRLPRRKDAESPQPSSAAERGVDGSAFESSEEKESALDGSALRGRGKSLRAGVPEPEGVDPEGVDPEGLDSEALDPEGLDPEALGFKDATGVEGDVGTDVNTGAGTDTGTDIGAKDRAGALSAA